MFGVIIAVIVEANRTKKGTVGDNSAPVCTAVDISDIDFFSAQAWVTPRLWSV